MQAKEIKEAAFHASKDSSVNISEATHGMPPQDRLLFLEMLYYYQLYSLGHIKLEDAKTVELQINSEYSHLSNALRLSQDEYRRFIRCGLETNIERTKLSKQLLTGDRNFIYTLLHLLDVYSGEMIYGKMYQIMRIPLNDQELDAMIAEVPEQYRRKMTAEEARTGVWNVVRHMNGDEGID